MAARSIATLSITFGLVSIPVKLYSATESSSAIRFKLMSSGGAHVRQQYVADEPAPAFEPPEAESLDEEPDDSARKPRERCLESPGFSPRTTVDHAALGGAPSRRAGGRSSVPTWSKATNSRRADSSSSRPKN